jgi:hypothetical protein
MNYIIGLLKNQSDITAITFPTYTFWGDIKYTADSWALMRGAKYYHRLFKWGPDYKYLTHEPPTIIDENGKDLRQKHWIKGEVMERNNIFMYHYSLLFPWQVEQKVKVYNDEDKRTYGGIINWAENNYFKLRNPYRVHNLFRYPSWLKRFKGDHPLQINKMMQDIGDGKIEVKLRPNEDVEVLLKSPIYNIKKKYLEIIEPFNLFWGKLVRQIRRIKNIPNKFQKLVQSAQVK